MYKYFFNKCKAINKLTPRYKMEQRARGRKRERGRGRGRSRATRKLIKNPLKETRNKQKLFSVENKTKTKKNEKSFVISQISQTFIMPFVLYCFVSVSPVFATYFIHYLRILQPPMGHRD